MYAFIKTPFVHLLLFGADESNGGDKNPLSLKFNCNSNMNGKLFATLFEMSSICHNL